MSDTYSRIANGRDDRQKTSVAAPINRIHLDKSVLVWFLALMTATNAVVLLVPWSEIMAGKNDFPIFYCSAQMVREGRSADLYNFDAENAFIRRVSDVRRPPNNHFPYELLLFVPLTFLPFGAAYITWTAVGFAMLAWTAFLMRDLGGGRLGFWMSFLAIVGFFPVWYCLLEGQDSILFLLLCALSFWFWRQGRSSSAGFALALGMFRPQLALPFAFITAIAGKWKFLRGFVAGSVLVGVLSLEVVGWHGMVSYLRILIAQGTQESGKILLHQWEIRPALMATWRGFLWILLPAHTSGELRNSLLLGGIFTGLLWAAKGLRDVRERGQSEMAFAVAIATVMLMSFHSFLDDFALMILPLLLLANRVSSPAKFSKWQAYGSVTLGLCFFLTPLYLVMLSTESVGLFFIVGVAALSIMALRARRDRSRSTQLPEQMLDA